MKITIENDNGREVITVEESAEQDQFMQAKGYTTYTATWGNTKTELYGYNGFSVVSVAAEALARVWRARKRSAND
jgi:hypothetical protein